VLNATAEFAPTVPLSKTIYMLQTFLSFLLILILVTLVISHRAQKTSSELDEVIAAVEGQGRQMEMFVQNEFNMPSIQVAIDRLKEAKAGLVNIIYWLSKGA
jgi:short subunit fatty acids transporter